MVVVVTLIKTRKSSTISKGKKFNLEIIKK